MVVETTDGEDEVAHQRRRHNPPTVEARIRIVGR
jgi:hypothetical protein